MINTHAKNTQFNGLTTLFFVVLVGVTHTHTHTHVLHQRHTFPALLQEDSCAVTSAPPRSGCHRVHFPLTSTIKPFETTRTLLYTHPMHSYPLKPRQ